MVWNFLKNEYGITFVPTKITDKIIDRETDALEVIILCTESGCSEMNFCLWKEWESKYSYRSIKLN